VYSWGRGAQQAHPRLPVGDTMITSAVI